MMVAFLFLNGKGIVTYLACKTSATLYVYIENFKGLVL